MRTCGTANLRRGAYARSAKQFSNINAQRSKGVGVEAIGLALRRAQEISDRRSAQAVQKPEDRAFLDDERPAAIEDRLGAGIVGDCDPHRYSGALERSPQRRLEQCPDRWWQVPL